MKTFITLFLIIVCFSQQIKSAQEEEQVDERPGSPDFLRLPREFRLPPPPPTLVRRNALLPISPGEPIDIDRVEPVTFGQPSVVFPGQPPSIFGAEAVVFAQATEEQRADIAQLGAMLTNVDPRQFAAMDTLPDAAAQDQFEQLLIPPSAFVRPPTNEEVKKAKQALLAIARGHGGVNTVEQNLSLLKRHEQSEAQIIGRSYIPELAYFSVASKCPYNRKHNTTFAHEAAVHQQWYAFFKFIGIELNEKRKFTFVDPTLLQLYKKEPDTKEPNKKKPYIILILESVHTPEWVKQTVRQVLERVPDDSASDQ